MSFDYILERMGWLLNTVKQYMINSNDPVCNIFHQAIYSLAQYIVKAKKTALRPQVKRRVSEMKVMTADMPAFFKTFISWEEGFFF